MSVAGVINREVVKALRSSENTDNNEQERKIKSNIKQASFTY